MATEVIRVDRDGDFTAAVRRAAAALADGGLVAFPTETVYGVAACVDLAEAVSRLRRVKERPQEMAFTVHIGSSADANQFVPELGGLASRFIRKAWPGPLTLILPVEVPAAAPIMGRLNGTAAEAMYYNNAIGLRYPDDSIAESILRTVTSPVVAASANLAGRPPAQTAEDVLRDLGGRIDLVVDGGRTRYARPSTIVRVSGGAYEIVREGVYDRRTLERLSTLRILFVCTGNTCRSPMAAGLAAAALAERLGCAVADLPARGVEVSSAGTSGGAAGGATTHAVEAMSRRGIDISQHRSTALTADMIRQADHTFVMTEAHREAALNLVPSASDRVALLLDGQDVRDPVGESEDEYEACARGIENGVIARLQEVIL